ncbi:hypothetical protein TNCV_2744151 [Trichonephila clavipes]|nr:hypothetical protein TNCV_2744151 [Trichonephila clavipes]
MPSAESKLEQDSSPPSDSFSEISRCKLAIPSGLRHFLQAIVSGNTNVIDCRFRSYEPRLSEKGVSLAVILLTKLQHQAIVSTLNHIRFNAYKALYTVGLQRFQDSNA